MTFDFSQTCNNTALRGDGIVRSDCAVEPFQDDNVTDLVPVSVGSIDILELDESLVLLSQASKFGTYLDGDSFDYESVSNVSASVNVTKYPRALQVSVIGNNAAGETLFFAGLMVFVTDCSVFPNLLEGSSIGWIEFVSYRRCSFLERPLIFNLVNNQPKQTSLTDPKPAVCPLVDASPTVVNDVPSSVSTSKSRKAPSAMPRSSKAPQIRPQGAPSLTPVASPTHGSNDDEADDDGDDDYCGKSKKKKSKTKEKHSSKGKGKKKHKKNIFGCHEKGSDKKHKDRSGKGGSGGGESLSYEDILDLLHSHPIPPTRGPMGASTTLHPTVSSLRVDDASSTDSSSSADDATADSSADDSSADYYPSDAKAGFVNPAVDPARPFWSSTTYYVVLCLIVSAALIGACLLCYQSQAMWSYGQRLMFRNGELSSQQQQQQQQQRIAMLQSKPPPRPKEDDETWMTE
jgi:hypothetical protein